MLSSCLIHLWIYHKDMKIILISPSNTQQYMYFPKCYAFISTLYSKSVQDSAEWSMRLEETQMKETVI